MIYGRPGDRNMARLLAFVRRSPVVPLTGGGHRLIQPVHVDDLAGFIATALEADAAVGRAFNVAGPEPLTLRQVVEATGRAVGRRPRLVPLPLGPAIAAVRAYERLSAKPRLKVEQVLGLNEDEAFDIGAAILLGYAPRSFAEGIEAEAALLR
jgi:nucleoside-diphosphate-sugar epimerase